MLHPLPTTAHSAAVFQVASLVPAGHDTDATSQVTVVES